MYFSVKLPVPYVKQYGPGADAFGKDCGPACSVMLLAAYTGERMTPDDFYRAITEEDRYISKSQLQTVLRTKGIESENVKDVSLAGLHAYLAAGKPGIALINYGVLRDHITTESTFTGPHFVVTVGMDDQHVYIHDPLWRTRSGAWLAVPHAAWLEAWERAKEQINNPSCSVLVPKQGLPVPPPPPSLRRVLAYWEPTGYYYPAVVLNHAGNDYTIRYDDGTDAQTTADCIEPLELAVGDEVKCKYADGCYYTATVKKQVGERVQVEYEDGSGEWTTLSHLRMWYDE